jgi:hemerythrin-like domain-containing protein
MLLDMLARYFSEFPDELHHKKEDIIHARLLASRSGGEPALPDLHREHADLSARARRFAEIVDNVLGDQELPIGRVVEEAERYSEALSAHMEAEEETLFKPARARFSTDDWSRIHEDIGEMYVTGINLEKARQVLALEQELDAYRQVFAAG